MSALLSSTTPAHLRLDSLIIRIAFSHVDQPYCGHSARLVAPSIPALVSRGNSNFGLAGNSRTHRIERDELHRLCSEPWYRRYHDLVLCTICQSDYLESRSLSAWIRSLNTAFISLTYMRPRMNSNRFTPSRYAGDWHVCVVEVWVFKYRVMTNGDTLRIQPFSHRTCNRAVCLGPNRLNDIDPGFVDEFEFSHITLR